MRLYLPALFALVYLGWASLTAQAWVWKGLRLAPGEAVHDVPVRVENLDFNVWIVGRHAVLRV